MEHIHATPGFAGESWPHAMTLAENLADLEMHARHFRERRGFTYTVLERSTGEVIGCVYIYPVGTPDADRSSDPSEHDASVRSWISARARTSRSISVGRGDGVAPDGMAVRARRLCAAALTEDRSRPR